jgi:hypothetical protein
MLLAHKSELFLLKTFSKSIIFKGKIMFESKNMFVKMCCKHEFSPISTHVANLIIKIKYSSILKRNGAQLI